MSAQRGHRLDARCSMLDARWCRNTKMFLLVKFMGHRLDDSALFHRLEVLHSTEGMRIEPSAAAGFSGPLWLNGDDLSCPVLVQPTLCGRLVTHWCQIVSIKNTWNWRDQRFKARQIQDANWPARLFILRPLENGFAVTPTEPPMEATTASLYHVGSTNSLPPKK